MRTICWMPTSVVRRFATARGDPSVTRRLACGAIAGPTFVVIVSIAGHKRAGYDRLRHAVSSLALGPGGLVQRANFIVSPAASVSIRAESASR